MRRSAEETYRKDGRGRDGKRRSRIRMARGTAAIGSGSEVARARAGARCRCDRRLGTWLSGGERGPEGRGGEKSGRDLGF